MRRYAAARHDAAQKAMSPRHGNRSTRARRPCKTASTFEFQASAAKITLQRNILSSTENRDINFYNRSNHDCDFQQN
jgi:hypothetical protein